MQLPIILSGGRSSWMSRNKGRRRVIDSGERLQVLFFSLSTLICSKYWKYTLSSMFLCHMTVKVTTENREPPNQTKTGSRLGSRRSPNTPRGTVVFPIRARLECNRQVSSCRPGRSVTVDPQQIWADASCLSRRRPGCGSHTSAAHENPPGLVWTKHV